MGDSRECAQCGKRFRPLREHARFCSAACRMTWNEDHGGTATAPAAAIDWSVTAMAEAVERFGQAGTWDLPRAAAAAGETVWWITLVDATLVRYHPRDYENTMAGLSPAARRGTEEALGGLRYVRNRIGRSTDPAELIQAGADGGWAWTPQAEPGLDGVPAGTREWELNRYRAYTEHLAGRDAAAVFRRCARFLEQAAGAVPVLERPAPGRRR
ncbi:MAG: hypothetical protein FWE35_17585 [Streptosporangiales bacterium]|nr:hypothetical protein [Streptosporangiales bacterium]